MVHIDCDAFYAAVEELDRPELKDVPFAVGVGVLTTCNYQARKFGCRSGMAGFVAKKLCPQLVSIPLNFDKYIAKAQEVRSVLATYDERFESASLDEAYLNVTEYCEKHQMPPEEAVSQLRTEIHEKCKITVSAGIAANAKLAKIGSNRNKPNGQFRLANDRAAIMAFMRDLPTRKVNGIGRVLERELDAIGVKTCGDIYAHRAYLPKLFGEKAFQFLIQCYLGLGRTIVQPSEEYERKSVGTESTFRDMSDPQELRDKLRHTAEELEKDLERTQFKGRTLCLKIKLHTYEVFTRQFAPPFAVHKADHLYRYSLPMLARLEKEFPNMKLRLMGLRVTHLVSTKKTDIDFFGLNKRISSEGDSRNNRKSSNDEGEWEVWPEEDFERAAREEQQEEMDELQRLSQEHDNDVDTNANGSGKREEEKVAHKEEYWDCPICTRPQTAEDKAFNEHMDYCLSKQTIKEVVRADQPEQAFRFGKVTPTPSTSSMKRGRSRDDGEQNGQRASKRKPFFA